MEAKPVFLLEEERQLLACPLVTFQAAVAGQRRYALDILQSLPRPSPPSGAESSSSAHRDSSDCDCDGHHNDDSRRDPDRDKDCDRDRDGEEPSHSHKDSDGNHDLDREHRDRESGERDKDRLEKMAEQEKELEAKQFLGSKKPPKRVIRIRPSEMFRFTFDWENTNGEMNPFYQAPHEARLLYGLAGIDRRELKKAATVFEKET